MRLFYDYQTPHDRQRLASTLFFFLLGVNGLLLAASLGVSPALASSLFGNPARLPALQWTLINTFAIGFTFFPFHVLRMENRAVEFGVMTLARSVSTVILRVMLIVGFGMGVMGVVVADVIVTALLAVALFRRFAPLVRPTFSFPILREALRFGLPRVPHAAAQQVIAVADKIILTMFVPLAQVGVYSMGVSFGLTQKLFLSAFEYAWAPFYYANSKEPDAARVFTRVTTGSVAVLVLLTAGLSAISRDLLVAVVGTEYESAAPVVTWTAVGVLFQGIYLLTSIGLNITRHTEYYPVATLTAAGVNVALNFLLIPRFGIEGAAWANGASYAVQAAVAYRFSQRYYPIPHDLSRLIRIAGAGAAAWAAAVALPRMPPLAGVLVRGLVVVLVFGTALGATKVFSVADVRALTRLRARRKPATTAPPEATERAGEIVAADLGGEVIVPMEGVRRE
jgi:O-antigen/teichoic acid export membrane protein